MNIVKAFNGEMVDFGACMGCTIANSYENTSTFSGQILKTKHFNIAQDSELPINGFIVIGSNRHINSINEMSNEEKIELITLIDITIATLKKLNVCQQYDVVWEEKEGNHFHVWLMPRHKYLLEAMGTNIIKKVGELFDYAKTNLITEDNLKEVYSTIHNLKLELNNNPTIQTIIL